MMRAILRRLTILITSIGLIGLQVPLITSALNTPAVAATNAPATYGTGKAPLTYGTGHRRTARKRQHTRAAHRIASRHLFAATLPAGVVQVNSATFVQTRNPCSCVVTIDGYLFQGLPYYDGTTGSAVGLWFALRAQPGYVSNPPITSISTTGTVSGTVGPPPKAGGSTTDTYGTG